MKHMKYILSFSVIAILILFACKNDNEEKKTAEPVYDSLTVINEDTLNFVSDTITISDTVFDDGSIPSSWENAGIANPFELVEFVLSFQQWVADDKKDSIAAHINFPLRKIKSREDFLQKYATVFNSAVKKKIANQNIRQIFRNENGVMLADGAVWINQKGQDFIITALNFNPKK
jgi:hypothetical protein